MESVKSNKSWLCTLCNKVNKQCINSTSNYNDKVFSKFIKFLSRHLLQQNGRSKVISAEAYTSLQKITSSDNLYNNVQICKQCEIFIQKFCDDYQKIKELELQLDFKVDKLWDILQDTNEVQLNVNQLQEPSTAENASDATRIYRLRSILKHNIEANQSIRKAKSFPRVYLLSETLNDVMPELEHVQDFIPRVFSPINLDESITLFDDDNKTSEQVFTDENNEMEEEFGGSSKSSTKSTVHKYNMEPASPKKPSNRFQCTFCTETFSVKFTLDQHTIRKHTAKYFSSVKLKFVTIKQFEAYLDHVIEKTVDEFPNVESKHQCPYCYIPKLFVERRSVKFHFVQHHRSVIKEKLIEVQKSNAKTKNWLPMKHSIAKPNVCQICSKVFKDGFNVQRHKTFVHPEIFFENSKLADEDDETFKIYVGYVTEKQVDQQFIKLKSAITVNHNKPKCKFKCVICSTIMIKRGEAKSHLVLKHRDFIEEALNEIRKSDKPFSEIKLELARFQYKSTTKYCPPAILRKLRDGAVEQQMECTICHKKFETSYELSRHDAFHHPDNFVLSVKSEHLTTTQFSLCVKHMFSKELGQFNRTRSSVKKKRKYICPCCKTFFTTLRDVRAHALLVHFDIMAEKLKVLQKDLKAEDL